MSKVLIAKPNEDRDVIAGVISVNPNKPKYGSITLRQDSFSIGIDGFVNESSKVAFLPGEVSTLEKMVDKFDLNVDTDLSEAMGQEYHLVVQEQAGKPYYEGQPCKINPSTGEELSDKDGQPIYRRTVLTTVNSDVESSNVTHIKDTVTAMSESVMQDDING